MFICFYITVIVILVSGCTYCYNTERLLRLKLTNNARKRYHRDYDPDSMLNFTELSQKYGYPSEEHTVITEDGYILTLFRILRKPHCKKLKGLPVLLQHGMFINAIAYLDAGPETGIAYLLADQCLDLWCGNARGTEYSRKHTHLDPDKDPEFWQYSFHEMGLYDLPAMVDYILNETESKKLRYVGFSQSMSAFFVLSYLKPEYINKFAVAVGMAPGIWYQESNSPFVRIGLRMRKLIYFFADSFGIQELLHTNSIVQEFFHLVCQKGLAPGICFEFLAVMDGKHTNSITENTLATMVGHFPDGVSLKSVNHILQNMMSGKFRQYDYESNNLNVYGEETPPEYSVKDITVPIFLMYGDNDHFVNSSDVVKLSKLLPNLKRLYRMELPGWNHLDFVWSKYVPNYSFPKVINSLNYFNF